MEKIDFDGDGIALVPCQKRREALYPQDCLHCGLFLRTEGFSVLCRTIPFHCPACGQEISAQEAGNGMVCQKCRAERRREDEVNQSYSSRGHPL